MDPISTGHNSTVQSNESSSSSSNNPNMNQYLDSSHSSAGTSLSTNYMIHNELGPTQVSAQHVYPTTNNTTIISTSDTTTSTNNSNSSNNNNTQVTSITNSNNTDITTMKNDNHTTKPITVNKRYKKLLHDLFTYKIYNDNNNGQQQFRNYDDDYIFTLDEINTITSNDIITLFNVKLFDQVQPKYPDLDHAFHTNHKTTKTLHYYIKAINFFTNYRNCYNYNNNNHTYNENTNIGNPTHSVRVKNYIQWIDDIEHGRGYKYDMENGTMKLQYLPITANNIVQQQVPPYTTTPIITTKSSSPAISKTLKATPTQATPPPPPTTTTKTTSLKHSNDSTKRLKVHHDNVVVPASTATNNNTHNNNNNNNIITTTINNTNLSSKNSSFDINNNNNSTTTTTTTTTTNNNTQTTAAITTNINNSNTTNTKPVKVNKTYQKLLRELFIFKKDDNGEYRNYNDDYIFTIDELNTITSNDIITLLNVKFFNDIEPIRPDFYHAFQIKRRRLSTIYYYIKIISSFVQYRNTNDNTYNEYTNIGNPTHSMKVQKYIQWIDDQLNGRAYKYNHDGTMKSEYLSFNEIGSNLPIQLPSSSSQPNFVVPVVVTPSTTKSTISTTTEVTSSTTIPIMDDTPATATTTTMESLNQMNESIQQLRTTIENSHTAVQLQINTLHDTIQQQYQQMMKLIQQQQQQQHLVQQQQQVQHPPSQQSSNPTK